MSPDPRFSVPPIVADHDDRWIEIDLRGDLKAWARQTGGDIRQRARAARQDRGPGERQLAGMLAGAAALARRAQDTTLALLLYPTLADGMVALARFCLVDLAGREGDAAWSDLVGWLTPGGGAGEAEITELEGAARPCRRVRRRYAEGGGGERPVGEHVGYAWVLDDYGAGVVLVTSFTDLEAAGRWRTALDALARGVTLDPAAGAERGTLG
jgi:hypothetical protein